VRGENIFRKLDERRIPSAPSAEGLVHSNWEEDLWSLVLDAASTRDVAERSVESLELSTLARHAFTLGQAFNHFYHRHPIATEPDADLRNRRLAVARIFQREMATLLELLGIPRPQRM
jgi:arginyl-tRNA synthetase